MVCCKYTAREIGSHGLSEIFLDGMMLGLTEGLCCLTAVSLACPAAGKELAVDNIHIQATSPGEFKTLATGFGYRSVLS